MSKHPVLRSERAGRMDADAEKELHVASTAGDARRSYLRAVAALS